MSRREFRHATTGRRIIIEHGVVIGDTGARLIAVELTEASVGWHWTVRLLPNGGVLRTGSAATESAARMAATEGAMR